MDPAMFPVVSDDYVLRITRWCWKAFVWNTPHPDGGIIWDSLVSMVNDSSPHVILVAYSFRGQES